MDERNFIYIFASYAISLIILAITLGWVLLKYWRLKRALLQISQQSAPD